MLSFSFSSGISERACEVLVIPVKCSDVFCDCDTVELGGASTELLLIGARFQGFSFQQMQESPGRS